MFGDKAMEVPNLNCSDIVLSACNLGEKIGRFAVGLFEIQLEHFDPEKGLRAG
jgi:hypothetical protein